jgi:hypothetical protein
MGCPQHLIWVHIQTQQMKCDRWLSAFWYYTYYVLYIHSVTTNRHEALGSMAHQVWRIGDHNREVVLQMRRHSQRLIVIVQTEVAQHLGTAILSQLIIWTPGTRGRLGHGIWHMTEHTYDSDENQCMLYVLPAIKGYAVG